MSIEQIVARIPAWQGRAVSIAPLAGGITNQNYLVEVDGTRYVVRVPGEATELLAVDRRNEQANARRAAEQGIGPEIVWHLPQDDVLVVAHLAGSTLQAEDLRRPGMPGRLAEAIRRLHGCGRFHMDFDMFALADRYLATGRALGAAVPADLAERWPGVQEVRQALEHAPLAAVPCHNDLLAGNLIDDGERLWIIDYEYSGNNDPCFELGNTAQEQEYDEVQLAELTAGYFGEARAELLARVRLQRIASDVGWALWALIQERISKLDFDFHSYALGRWARAMGHLDEATLASDLRQARLASHQGTGVREQP